MRVATVFGPWLLVGGGPSKKSNLAGGGTTFLNSRPQSAMKHFEETTHVFLPPNHVAFENHVDIDHSNCNNHLMPPPVNAGHGFLNDQRQKINRYNAVSGSPAQIPSQRHSLYYSIGDSMDNGGPDTLHHQHPGKQQQSQPLDYSNPSINIISGKNNNHSRASTVHPNLEHILETFVARLGAIQNAHLNRNEVSDCTKEMLEEWGYLARVVDRFFAAIYFLVNILCLIPFVPFYAGWAN